MLLFVHLHLSEQRREDTTSHQLAPSAKIVVLGNSFWVTDFLDDGEGLLDKEPLLEQCSLLINHRVQSQI